MKFIFLLMFAVTFAYSNTYQFCKECELNSFNTAFDLLEAGDTLLIKEDSYNGGIAYKDLKGEDGKLIYIIGDGDVIINGGNTAIQLSDWAYVRFENITFQNQVYNGVNVDDAGTMDSPTHHIQFYKCTFKDIQNTGNNDLLKLSGLDNYLVSNCAFENGSPGGSGIDMVGCHSSTITQNIFKNMGSNAIQCKGGTSEIYIERNMFINAGWRGINLGGNTNLAYFRPNDANYEARNLWVNSNIFVGCEAPFGFVGSYGVKVYNNTIIKPDKWIFRILQETIDGDRFIECGDAEIINNLFYVDGKISNTPVNIGANTRPETFDIRNNFFYNSSKSNWSPNLINPDINFLNIDPMINEDYSTLDSNSVLVGKGINEETMQYLPKFDFNGREFLNPRSIGAIEGGVEEVTTGIWESKTADDINYSLQGNLLEINSKEKIISINIFDFNGRELANKVVNSFSTKIELVNRLNIILLQTENGRYVKLVSQ